MHKAVRIGGIVLGGLFLAVGMYLLFFFVQNQIALNNASLQLPNASVRIFNMSFIPQNIVIAEGTTLVWINEDQVPHTITSSNSSMLNSGPILVGANFSYTFSKKGEYWYTCTIHPSMRGIVVVN